MFIKPFQIKNNVQMKGSEVKNKLKVKLKLQFSLSEENVSQLIAVKAAFQAVKVVTNSEQHVTIYTADKKPILFEYEERLFPTVYRQVMKIVW